MSTAHAITLPSSWSSSAAAWIYPGEPACDAATIYSEDHFDVLKPEYYVVGTNGRLLRRTVATNGCNGYSPVNAASVKAHSNEQYVTVAANRATMAALVTNKTRRNEAVKTLVTFINTISFTGVELDFEGFHSWTATEYKGYKQFVQQLGNALHGSGKKLMIDGPGFGNMEGTGTYQWKYDEIAALPIDYIVIMAYDYQFDFGAGAAVSPNTWLEAIVSAAQVKIGDMDRVVIGIPAYGYHGTIGGGDITLDTKAQSMEYPGVENATRDPLSFEMRWEHEGIHYRYMDQAGLDMKRALLETLGVQHVSVWHLGGGNDWFSER